MPFNPISSLFIPISVVNQNLEKFPLFSHTLCPCKFPLAVLSEYVCHLTTVIIFTAVTLIQATLISPLGACSIIFTGLPVLSTVNGQRDFLNVNYGSSST